MASSNLGNLNQYVIHGNSMATYWLDGKNRKETQKKTSAMLKGTVTFARNKGFETDGAAWNMIWCSRSELQICSAVISMVLLSSSDLKF